MKKYNKYLRPYCKKCNVIYSMIKNIGLKNCTHCGTPIKFKSYNPYTSLILGLIILGVGVASLIISVSPIIWIGGFIWGGSLVIKSFDTWDKIKELDKF